LVVIILSGAASIGVRYFEQQDNYSLWFLIVFTAIVLFLSVSGLIRHVQTIIDRIYYHDWFNYRKALRRLGEDLSEAVNEELIIQILTERLPDILKLHKATLIIKGEEDMWLVPSQMIPIADDKIGLVIDENISKLSQLGYEIILPLTHSGKMIGVLLLGRKLSEAPFSVRDHQLLNTLSNHAGTALANLALTSKLIDNEKRAIAVDMAGGIAHEINNALAPLMGHAQLIEMSMLGNIDSSMRETLKQPLSIIVDMCNRIQRITSNLSKISEPLHLEESLISLNTIAEETLQLMTETAGRIKRYQTDSTEAKYRLRKDFLRNLPLVKGDSQQLSQVFINLIINASDAIEENKQGILTVGTRLSTDRSFVIGFVADTGSGISKQVLDKIFQPYFTTKPKGKGTGLGMSIVRSIVEAHGGHLTVHSTEGRGTRVEFYLPVPD